MGNRVRALIIFLVAISGTAEANTTKLDIVWSGTQGTVVSIHGKGNCTMSSLGSYDSRCGTDPRGYWLNSTNDGGDGHDFMDEATARNTTNGWLTWEAISIRYDGENQAFWSAAADVAACMSDLAAGTNSSGCNPSLIRRTSFRVVAHSEGGTIIDRIFSTGWWPQLTGAGGAIVGNVVTSSGALAGARSSSALYGVDGASNFCTTLVSWVIGWALKDPGSQSLTRGSVIGEANNGMAGKSPRWFNKMTTTGGSGSCNNNSSNCDQRVGRRRQDGPSVRLHRLLERRRQRRHPVDVRQRPDVEPGREQRRQGAQSVHRLLLALRRVVGEPQPHAQ